MNNTLYVNVKDLTINDKVVKDIILSNYIPIQGKNNIGAIEISSNLTISKINDSTKLPGSIAYGLGSLAVGSEFNDIDSRIVKYVSIDDLNSNAITWSSLNEYVLSNNGQLSSEVIDVLTVVSDDLVYFSELGGFIWRKYTDEVDSKFTVEDASVEQLNSMTHVQDNYYKLYRLTDSGQISSYLYGLSGMTVTRNSSGKWVLLRTRAIAKGNGTFAQGTGIAYGENSFAIGGARAQSYQSFAQGGTTSFAFGRYSHAEGNSKAYGTIAHSEGGTTFAVGYGAHSEGGNTSAFGMISHSEGLNTVANEYGAHSEGATTYANGQHSHAEGFETSATGPVTHTTGWRTLAVGQASFAEGSYTSAYGEYSHTEGSQTKTDGKFSHAEGANSVASGYRSHAEGAGSYAIGDGSHAEGFNVSAEGQGAHAAGFGTYAKGAGSYAAGNGSYTQGNFSEATGYQTSAEGNYSRAHGKLTYAVGGFANAEGLSTIVYGDNSHADGLNVKLSAKSAYAWSGTETEYSVPTTRNGTFNIDPVGDIDGFYIGNRSLSTIIASIFDEKVGLSTTAQISGEISSAISNSLNLGELAHADKFEPLSGQTFELSNFDTRDMLKLIISSLGGKLTLNGEEI